MCQNEPRAGPGDLKIVKNRCCRGRFAVLARGFAVWVWFALAQQMSVNVFEVLSQAAIRDVEGLSDLSRLQCLCMWVDIDSGEVLQQFSKQKCATVSISARSYCVLSEFRRIG